TMEDVLHHLKAVTRAKPSAFVAADMPFMSYQASVEEAVRNAGRLVKEGGAEGVKLEGGAQTVKAIRKIVDASIPVVGHIGLTPQSLHQFGGYRVQGKNRESAGRLLEDAVSLEEAGCCCIVVEGVPWQVAEEITGSVGIPTIGIGAGKYCDGQVLVIQDMLGINEIELPRFVKTYENMGERMKTAIQSYVREVKEGKFPGMEHSYSANKSGRDGR
ncbi:MAG: 3-methyl-2-oxobutanoate hydroxymethyltransferase, partial [Candidatus Krumholzibacteriota bacterium]